MSNIIDLMPRLRAATAAEPVPRLAHELLCLLAERPVKPEEHLAALALAARALRLLLIADFGQEEAERTLRSAYMLSRLYEPGFIK